MPMNVLRHASLTLLLLGGLCQPVFAQGVSGLATGTYQFTFSNAQPGAPLPSGSTLTMVLAPGGAVCVAGYVLANPVLNGTGSRAVWDAPSLGLKLVLPDTSQGFNGINLLATSDVQLGVFSGTRTSTSITGCSTGDANLDFAAVSELYAKAEALYPALFPADFAADALSIIDGVLSRHYPGSGITVSIRNGRVLVSGGDFGATPQDVGDVRTIINTLLGAAPAPRAFPNQPVSWTLAGGLAQVLKPRSAVASLRADELAGVTRAADANWKEYVPGRARADVISALRPKLKSIIEDMWSGGQGILFPESYGIDRSVNDIIENIEDLQWTTLPTKLKPDDISNLSYEYMTLKRLLALENKTGLFLPLQLDAVSLAVPVGGFDRSASMKALGPKISEYIGAWLASNRTAAAGGSSGGSGSTGGSNTTSALLDEIFLLAAGDWRTGLAPAQTLAITQTKMAQLATAAGKLPTGYTAFTTAANAMSKALLDLATCEQIPDDFCLDESDALLTAVLDFSPAYFAAIGQTGTQTGSTGTSTGTDSNTTESVTAFYQRFLGDVATELNRLYETTFDEIFQDASGIDSRTYTPVVISALLYDTTRVLDPARTGPDNCCGFRNDELEYYDDPRAGVLYRARGESAKFGATEHTRFQLVAPLRIERERITASSLNTRRGEALTLAKEIVLSSSSQPLVFVAACVSTDEACLRGLDITEGGGSVDTVEIDSASWFSYLSFLGSSLESAGGLRLHGPVWHTPSAVVDTR